LAEETSSSDIAIAEPVVLEGTDETPREQLKIVQENLGHMCELAKEEADLVNELISTLAIVLKPFCETIEISTSKLPKGYQERLSKAFLDRNGRLILVYKDEEIEVLDLREKTNREIVTEIIDEILSKLAVMVTRQRSKIEKRVKALIPVAKELQKAAKILEEL